ncbi:MAG: nuclear transport factor 2 family protein [Jiangellales bacterium]
MTAVTPHPFRAAVDSRDVDAMVSLLDPQVRLYSPVAFKPFVGHEQVRALFTALFEVFEGFHYVDELAGDGTHALIFRTQVRDAQVQGLDHMVLGADGLVTEFTVMVRPLSAAIALAEAMAPRVGHLVKG